MFPRLPACQSDIEGQGGFDSLFPNILGRRRLDGGSCHRFFASFASEAHEQALSRHPLQPWFSNLARCAEFAKASKPAAHGHCGRAPVQGRKVPKTPVYERR